MTTGDATGEVQTAGQRYLELLGLHELVGTEVQLITTGEVVPANDFTEYCKQEAVTMLEGIASQTDPARREQGIALGRKIFANHFADKITQT